MNGLLFAFLSFAPEAASSAAAREDAIFAGLLIVCGLVAAALLVANLTFLIRYRRGSPASRAPLTFKTWKLETTWITATTMVFLGFFFWGGTAYLDETRAPANTYDITVVGRQWMWDIRHPNGRREFDELHVPVGRAVRLLLSSEDVIHSFFVPAFRVKLDVVPGKTSSLWFKPTKEGVYRLFCTQFCGTKHSMMTGSVVVLAPEAYADWLATGNTNADVVARGREIFLTRGCSGCHSPQSPIHAPMLEGLFDRSVPLSDGTFVTADDRYLRDSILQPQREVVAGYQPVMPSFEGVISENDLLDVVTYIKSLRNAPPPVATPQPLPPEAQLQ
jgi:cytochrome c oxidase subunit 2